jgi:hypothetical protein
MTRTTSTTPVSAGRLPASPKSTPKGCLRHGQCLGLLLVWIRSFSAFCKTLIVRNPVQLAIMHLQQPADSWAEQFVLVWGGRRPDCMAGEQPHAGGLPTPARSGGHRMAPGSGDNPRCWGGHTTDSLILECVHCSLTAHEGSALSS